MVYTSGTTGLPKGIRREPPTPQQVTDLMAVTRLALGIEPGMRALLSAPLYHSAPTSYAVQSMLVDAQLVLEPRFDAERTLQLIESLRLTHLYLVPTMYVRLLGLPEAVRRRYDLSSVRYVGSTGSPCPVEVKRRMIDWWGPVFHEAYAASELGWVTHIDSADSLRKPGSAGRALPGVTLKVLSEDGVELPAGEVGLLHARAKAMPDFTYANNDAARRRLERDGLWTLGDMGYLDHEGFAFIVDRKNDMVIFGRREHLPVRDRGHADDDARRGRLRRLRCARRRVRRGRARGRAARRTGRRQRGRREILPARAPGRLQGATPGGLPRAAAARRHRQDLQAQAARALLGGAPERRV
jgi:long-chain acyl-CoA synthetase